jgi:hypothetical protein
MWHHSSADYHRLVDVYRLPESQQSNSERSFPATLHWWNAREVTEQLLPPTNVTGIHSFLGHAGFYGRFIQNFSQIPRSLTHLLDKDTPFVFMEDCLQLFHTLKKALVSAPVIQPPDWHLMFEIMCDASDYVVGVVLGQPKNKKHYAISYASKTD